MAKTASIEIPYAPRYPEVHDTLESRRFTVLVAHRRFGKTVLVVNHLIRAACISASTDGHFAYIAPFRNQAKDVAWAYLKRYTAPIPGRRVNESDLSISLPSNGGGSKIRIFGADNPDALRGLYFDGVVLDEVAQMKPEIWGEIIQPALADRMGWAVFIGTPKGINLFSELYNQARKEQAKGNPAWAALCYPVNITSALPQPEVERLRAELSENKFRQEMLCDFNASNDDTLISQDEVEAALSRDPNWELINQYPLIVGVDVARFGGDSTVFFGRRHNYAFRPVVLQGYSNTEVAHRLMAHIAEFHPAEVNIDQGQGTGVIDLVRDLTRMKDVVITMTVHEGFHTYAYVADEDPFIPTEVNIELPEDYEKSGSLVTPTPTPSSTAMTYYTGNGAFRQRIKGNGDGEVVCKVKYQACDASMCMPPVTKTITLAIR